MTPDHYKTPEDFLNDESFIAFVYEGKDQNDWDLWLNAHPEKKSFARKAAAILKFVQLKEPGISEQQILNAEMKLRSSISQIQRPGKVVSFRKKVAYWSAAAVIVLLIALSIPYLNSPKQQLATHYGQVLKQLLPDGSEVILNANSHITLGKEWKKSREVWIEGEAFFHVKKTVDHDKFIVHTKAFDIEVTGTSFNVTSAAEKSSVILKEGSVKIHRKGEAEITMKPGDFVEFANDQIEKKKIVKDDYLAWTLNKLVFDNTDLPEVARMITAHYGIEVKLEGEGIEEKTITGILPNDNLDVLLEALEATQEYVIHRTDDTIIITAKKHL